MTQPPVKCSSVTSLTMSDQNVQRAGLLLRLVRLVTSKTGNELLSHDE